MNPARASATTTVLVALDDSPVSVRAAREAVRLFSRLPHVSFLVVNVSPIPVPWVGTTGFGTAGTMLVDPNWARAAHAPTADEERKLLDDASALGMCGADVELREGDPVEQICKVADEHDVDVIVIGSHDKSGLRRLFDPSVADAIVHRSPRPVLVVSGAQRTEPIGGVSSRGRRVPWRVASMVMCSLALVLAGCGSSSDGGTGTAVQPAPNVTTFQPGDFDQLPRPPRSSEAGTRTDTGATTVQSFTVPGTTPEEVLQYFASHLGSNWIPTSPPHPEGATAWRGVWMAGGDRLEVSAAPAPAVAEGSAGETPHVQYSLLLTNG